MGKRFCLSLDCLLKSRVGRVFSVSACHSMDDLCSRHNFRKLPELYFLTDNFDFIESLLLNYLLRHNFVNKAIEKIRSTVIVGAYS